MNFKPEPVRRNWPNTGPACRPSRSHSNKPDVESGERFRFAPSVAGAIFGIAERVLIKPAYVNAVLVGFGEEAVGALGKKFSEAFDLGLGAAAVIIRQQTAGVGFAWDSTARIRQLRTIRWLRKMAGSRRRGRR
jgi:hypothetical protein